MPSPRVRAVIALLDEMNEEERKELHHELENACSPSDWKQAWNEELSRRVAQIEAGDVELVDGDKVLADLAPQPGDVKFQPNESLGRWGARGRRGDAGVAQEGWLKRHAALRKPSRTSTSKPGSRDHRRRYQMVATP